MRAADKQPRRASPATAGGPSQDHLRASQTDGRRADGDAHVGRRNGSAPRPPRERDLSGADDAPTQRGVAGCVMPKPKPQTSAPRTLTDDAERDQAIEFPTLRRSRDDRLTRCRLHRVCSPLRWNQSSRLNSANDDMRPPNSAGISRHADRRSYGSPEWVD